MRKIIMPFVIFVVAASASAQVQIKDVSAYTKLKSNLNGKTQQEFGVSASFWKQDRWSLGGNVGFSYNYPLTNIGDRAPSYTAGVTLRYRLVDDASKLSLYTKLKHDLVNTFQQETGVSATLWSKNETSVSANIGYVQDYPFKSGKPNWTAGVSLAYKF